MADGRYQTKIITFGKMTPDSSLYAGADTEVMLRSGCAMYSGQPLLIPTIRKILAGTTTGAAGFSIKARSNALSKLYFANSEPKLWEWSPNPLSSTLVDRTPAATFESVLGNFFKWGGDSGNPFFVYIPETRGTANVAKKFEPGVDSIFVNLVSSGTEVLGKCVGRVQSHMLIANAWDSVNGYEANRWHWSARGNCRVWTNGSNEAGYGYITGEPEGNEIEEMVTWNDFAVMFTRTGLYRIGYQGGLTKWDPQQIGQAHQTIFGRPAIKAGRDCYYIGTDGPRMISNGEESLPIGFGRIARTLMDRTNYGYSIESLLNGGYDKSIGAVWWVYLGADAQWWVALYMIESDEFTVTALGSPSTNKWGAVASIDEYLAAAKLGSGSLGTTGFFDQTKPLSSLVLIPSSSETAGGWKLWGQHYDDGAGGISYNTYPAQIKTKIERLSPERSEIISVRPLYRTNAAAEGLVLTIDIEYGDHPMLKSTDYGVTTPLTVSTANADEKGEIRDLLPGARGFFHRFSINVPAASQALSRSDPLTDYQSLLELSGIEVVSKEIGSNA